jgi:nucleoside-diphosphate-sugar epimerase
MRVLVTGGSGYFGEILVQRLRERGDDVGILDIIDNADRSADVWFVNGDVRDRKTVDKAMESVDVVHHNVAQVPLAKNRHEFWSVNVDGTENVLEAARAAGVRKVVLMSSSAVHGVPEANPVTRNSAPAPREAYGRAKLESERLADRYRDRGLDVSIIRPRTILGHGRLGIFQILFEWVRRDKPLYLLGPGDNRYQFVHSDDLADAALRAADREGSQLYLCGTDRFGTMRELLEALVAHANSRSPIRSLPFRATQAAMVVTSKLGLSPLGDYHSLMYGRGMWFDIEDARRELEWAPKYSNAEMICDSYDWYLAHRDEVLARRDASHHRSAVKLGALKLLERLPWPTRLLG